MGDIIYPGVMFYTQTDSKSGLKMKMIFTSVFGQRSFLDGEVKVQVFEGRILVSGLQLPLDEIQLRLRNHFETLRLRKEEETPEKSISPYRHLCLSIVDFGLPRINKNADVYKSNYLDEEKKDGDMEHRTLLLHNELKKGQGNLGVINIFNDDFLKDFGAPLKRLKNKIYFNKPISLTMSAHLRTVNGFLFEEPLTESTTGLIFSSKIQAMQAICILFWNSLLPEFKTGFKLDMNKHSKECSLTTSFGFGINGDILDVDAMILKYGYVPFLSLNNEVFSQKRIKRVYADTCIHCSQAVNIVGISADLSWFAGQCGCDAQRSNFGWGNEDFLRYGMTSAKQKLFLNYGSGNLEKNKLFLLIRGVMPAFQDVSEFRRTAFAASSSELSFVRKSMKEEQEVCKVLRTKFIEQVYVNETAKLMYATVLQIKSTARWNKDGLEGIKTIALFSTDDNSAYSFHAVRKHKGISAVPYASSEAKDGKIELTVLITASKDDIIKKNQCFKAVPKPQTCEHVAIRNVLSKWKKAFSYRTQRNIFVADLPSSPQLICSTAWQPAEPDYPVWSLYLSIEKSVGQVLRRWLPQCYVGAHICFYFANLCHQPNANAEARVLQVTECKDQNKFTLDVVAVTEPELPVWNATLCFVKFWMIMGPLVDMNAEEDLNTKEMAQSEEEKELAANELNEKINGELGWDIRHYQVSNVVNLIRQDMSLIDDEQDDEDCRSLDAGGDLENECFIDCKSHGFGFHKAEVIPIPSSSSIQDILASWLDEPTYEFSQLDWLLKPSLVVRHTRVIHERVLKSYVDEDKVTKILTALNPSQKLAVQKMLENKFAILQGPPGTGKTTTNAHGAAVLSLREEGLIVVTALSNFAVDVAFERFVKLNDKYDLGINVLRMLSYRKERQLLSNLDKEDPYKLINKVASHPLWRDNEKVTNIMKKLKEVGLVELTKNERSWLTDVLITVEVDCLATADIVFCTIGAACDNRIKAAIATRQRKGLMGFSSLIIDEGSYLSVPQVLPLMALNPSRVWLLGDDQQLSRVVSDPSAENACLSVSVMELLKMSEFVKTNMLETMLETQYRMEVGNAGIISKFLYNGRVNSSVDVQLRDYSSWYNLHQQLPELKSTNTGLFTYDGNCEVFSHKSTSVHNPTEVAITMDLLKKLKRARIDLSIVVILSLYDAQLKELRRELNRCNDKEMQNVQLATSDSFQGKESPIVILNFVRSNSKNNIGFLREQRRTNVALSRSIDYNLVVCDIRTLWMSNIPDVKRLFKLWMDANVTARICNVNGNNVDDSQCQPLQAFIKKL